MERKPLKSLLIPEEGRIDVEALLSLSAARLQVLDETLRDRQALRDEKRTYQRIAEELEVSPREALSILSAIRNIRRQRERLEITDAELFEDLNSVSPIASDAEPILGALLGRSEDDYFVEKVGGLRQVLLPQLTEMRSVVDARPVFDRAKEKLEGMVLVAYLDLGAYDPNSRERTNQVIQVSRKQIQELRDLLDETEKKLDKLGEALEDHDVFE
ncbi:MAG: hypothetical protein H6716_17165 [Polyangiaceae bacterium]|nr:hypothetical protein [Polyangiaceae bacterium]